jgi:hypothetical protein
MIGTIVWSRCGTVSTQRHKSCRMTAEISGMHMHWNLGLILHLPVGPCSSPGVNIKSEFNNRKCLLYVSSLELFSSGETNSLLCAAMAWLRIVKIYSSCSLSLTYLRESKWESQTNWRRASESLTMWGRFDLRPCCRWFLFANNTFVERASALYLQNCKETSLREF